MRGCLPQSCFQWNKDTKMKANHNVENLGIHLSFAVSNGTKILKWKQITTYKSFQWPQASCFQWNKDTKMKANHNPFLKRKNNSFAVSNGTKILKWKQITTMSLSSFVYTCCFQWNKDTKMKANHNFHEELRENCLAVSNGTKILKWKQITTYCIMYLLEVTLFPMEQRY